MSKAFTVGDTLTVAHRHDGDSITIFLLTVVEVDGSKLRVSGNFVAEGDTFVMRTKTSRDLWWIDSRTLVPFVGPVANAFAMPRKL